MRAFKRENTFRGGPVPGDRPADGYVRVRGDGYTLRRIDPKPAKGKAAVKAAKRKRIRTREQVGGGR